VLCVHTAEASPAERKLLESYVFGAARARRALLPPPSPPLRPSPRPHHRPPAAQT